MFVIQTSDGTAVINGLGQVKVWLNEETALSVAKKMSDADGGYIHAFFVNRVAISNN